MLPNPLSEVGRVYEEVRQLKSVVNNKANNWELSSLSSRIDALSQDVRTLSESVMDIYNKLDIINNQIQEI
jgi:uncharacterized coiled-coil DUF342 family protein